MARHAIGRVAPGEVRWLPATRVGWWAIGLTAVTLAASLVGLTGAWPVSIGFAFPVLAVECALALVALVSRHDRAVLVWLAFAPTIVTVVLFVGYLVLGG